MDEQLAKQAEAVLPADVAERCNGRLHVAVSLAKWPLRLRKRLLSRFDDRAHLIEALRTSCYIPAYSARGVTRPFEGRRHMDGGFTEFMPEPPGCRHTVKARMRAAV